MGIYISIWFGYIEYHSANLYKYHIQQYQMFYNKFDSYYYSRPVSYRSYNPRLTRPQILTINDRESQQVMNFLRQNNFEPTDHGGLARGIRFNDFQLGRRKYNHNSYGVKDEYFIHQWKKTNDLTNEHPTGVHLVFDEYPKFLNKLRQIVQSQRKK